MRDTVHLQTWSEFVEFIGSHGSVVNLALAAWWLGISRQRLRELVEQGKLTRVLVRGESYVMLGEVSNRRQEACQRGLVNLTSPRGAASLVKERATYRNGRIPVGCGEQSQRKVEQ